MYINVPKGHVLKLKLNVLYVGLAHFALGLAKISWDSHERKLRVRRTRKYRKGGKTLLLYLNFEYFV